MNIGVSHVRWAIRRDLPAMLDIEQASSDDPWEENDFLAHARQRVGITIVFETPEDKIVGYAAYSLRDRVSLTIEKLAVMPEHQRTRVGTNLLERIVRKRKLTEIFVEDKNLIAHLFLRAFGFKATQVMRGQYGNPDYYLFQYER